MGAICQVLGLLQCLLVESSNSSLLLGLTAQYWLCLLSAYYAGTVLSDLHTGSHVIPTCLWYE